MTRTCLTSLVLAVSFLFAVDARADLTDIYGVDINDGSTGTNLFTYVNEMFGKDYTSSNEMYNDIGVAPTSTWTAAGNWQMATLEKGTAGFDHRLIISGDLLENDIVLDGRGAVYQEDGMIPWGNAEQLPEGVPGEFTFGLEAYGASWSGADKEYLYTWSSDPAANLLVDGNTLDVRMLAFDITELYNGKYGEEFDSVFLYAWEDMHSEGFLWENWETWAMDRDYQDAVFIIANVKPLDNSGQNVTPEPSTLAMLGFGLTGLVLARRRMKKQG